MVAEAGHRKNEGKPQIGLVPPEAIMAMAEVLTKGLEKYPADNWTKGMDWSKHYDAAQRHLLKWQSGIDLDEETGLSHLAHALTNLSFILTYFIRNIGKDDRCKNPLKQKTITTTQT